LSYVPEGRPPNRYRAEVAWLVGVRLRC